MNKEEAVKLRDEVNLLTRSLSQINKEKRQRIDELEKIRKEIRDLLKILKELKGKNSGFKEELDSIKEQREIHNKNVKDLISQLKELNNKKNEIVKKHKLENNPLDIKSKITSLENKIEMEVMSFEKEKKLMAEIKKLKDLFKKCGDVFAIDEQVEKISKNIKEEREKADNFHNKFKELVKLNKDKNKYFKDIFRKLDSLRESEDIKNKEFSGVKKNIDNLNNDLNNKLKQIGENNLVINSIRENRIRLKKEADEKIIEEKTRLVEDKLKNKMKLTTDDFLVYQSRIKHE